MASPGGKLTALACHPTKKVNKAEELTYFSTSIGLLSGGGSQLVYLFSGFIAKSTLQYFYMRT
jgi:hypothetical protein